MRVIKATVISIALAGILLAPTAAADETLPQGLPLVGEGPLPCLWIDLTGPSWAIIQDCWGVT
jgi:hypothetical protein